MKNLLLFAIVVTAFIFTNEAKAQVRFNVHVNIGSRPSWGIPGDSRGDYYYLPEIDAYYDIPNRQFIYFDGGQWLFSYELPYLFRGYDLYRGCKVMINEPRPYLRGNFYRERYQSYYNNYRSPSMFPQAMPYGNYHTERYNNSRYDRDGNRRDYQRDERKEHNEWGRDHDHDRGRSHRERG